jgi:hypothetical protein
VLFGPEWQLAGLTDMNADGVNDLVFIRGSDIVVNIIGEQNGRPATVEAQQSPIFQFVNDPSFALNGQVAKPLATWKLVGLEDMNGDQQPDFVFYSETFKGVVLWLTNANNQVTDGFRVTGPGGTPTPPAPGAAEALGDFDGDGDTDILWRDGEKVSLWIMNGTQFASQQEIPPSQLTAPVGFTLAGVGDFNGDNVQDVVWRNSATNDTVLWLFNAANVTSPTPELLPKAGSPDWTIGAVADMDGDGTDDILWRNSELDTAVYWRIIDGQLDVASSGDILNFLPVVGTGNPIATLDPDWEIAGANPAPEQTSTTV